MKTIILEKPGQFIWTDTSPPDAPDPGEALVRVKRVGICGTDLHAYRGRQPYFTYPRILGHELGVEVVEVVPEDSPSNSGNEIKKGDLCAVEPYMNCGNCLPCRADKSNCCTKLNLIGVHSDGGMRELIKVPINKLHKSSNLSLEQLALVETLGIGAHAVDRGGIQKGETILVIGAGPIGLAVIQFAKLAGARIILMEINQDRIAFSKEQFQVEHIVDASKDPLEQLADLLGDDLPIAVFDATGNPQSMMAAFIYVASGGRFILVSLVKADITFYDPEFHRREMTLLSTRNSTGKDFRRIIELMESKEVDTQPWITHRTPFDGMIGEFESWLEPETGVVKAMVEL